MIRWHCRRRRGRRSLAAAFYREWCERMGTNPMAPAALADRFDDGGGGDQAGMRVGPYLVTAESIRALSGAGAQPRRPCLEHGDWIELPTFDKCPEDYDRLCGRCGRIMSADRPCPRPADRRS